MKNLIQIANKLALAATGITLLLLQTACNKTNDAKLQSSESSLAPVNLHQKVLFVIADGAMGTEVKAVAPPVLNSLTNHAIYSWTGLTDYKYTDVNNASTWTTLLTGVNPAKHSVVNSMGTANLGAYPTVFTRLKTAAPTLRTVALTSVDSLKTGLATDATVANSFGGDDAATHTAALAEIKNNNPDLLLVEYNKIDAAGAADAYAATSATYSAAILQTDTYIGQLIDAVKARTNYANENWLIVITSNKGSNTGLPDKSSWNAFDDNRHNTFAFYYSPRFVPKATARPTGVLPYAGSSASYTIDGGGSDNYSYVPNDSIGGLMDFKASSQFTLQCKVKIPPPPPDWTYGYIYPAFLGKVAAFNNSKPGFFFFLQGNNWYFSATTIGSKPDVGVYRDQCAGSTCSDNQWHTLTGVVRIENGQRKLITYTDGVRNSSTNIGMANDYTCTADFRAGWIPETNWNGNIDGCFITDVRVYNVALSENYINNNSCATIIDPSDPYIGNLVGFWPGNSVNTDVNPVTGTTSYSLQDFGPHHLTMFLNSAKGNQISFNDQSPNVCPPVSVATYKSVPNNADAMPVIYSWFKFPVPATWNLDGQVWVPNYNDLIN